MSNIINECRVDNIINNMDSSSIKVLCNKLAKIIIENDSECGMMKILLECLKVSN